MLGPNIGLNSRSFILIFTTCDKIDTLINQLTTLIKTSLICPNHQSKDTKTDPSL